jgi:hypothetical protein
MGETQALWEHRLLTRLTTIKLAVGILDRRAALSDSDRDLLRLALEASDCLADDILNAGPTEGSQAAGRMGSAPRPRRMDSAVGHPTNFDR